MAARPYNAVHLAILDSRGVSSKAAFAEVCCNFTVEKVTDFVNGKVQCKRPITLVGCEFAPGILINVKDNGKIITSILGTVSLHFDLLDLDYLYTSLGTSYRRWVAILNEKAQCVGHLLVELVPDTSLQITFKVIRAENPVHKWRYAFLRLNVRDKEFKTKIVDGDEQVWNETFKIALSRNDSLHLTHLSDEIILNDSLGQATLTLNDLLSGIGQEKRVDLIGEERSGTLVYLVSYDTVSQVIPLRIVKGINLAKTDLDLAGDPYVLLKLGGQEYKTNIREGTDPEWEDEFLCTVEPQMSLEFFVKDDDVTFDDVIGTASMTGREVIEKKGTVVTLPIRNSKNQNSGSILLAIALPFGYELNQKFRGVGQKGGTVGGTAMSGGSVMSTGGSVYDMNSDTVADQTFSYRPADRNVSSTSAAAAASSYSYPPATTPATTTSTAQRYLSPSQSTNSRRAMDSYVVEAPPAKLSVTSADERYASYRRGDASFYSSSSYVPVSQIGDHHRVHTIAPSVYV